MHVCDVAGRLDIRSLVNSCRLIGTDAPLYRRKDVSLGPPAHLQWWSEQLEFLKGHARVTLRT